MVTITQKGGYLEDIFFDYDKFVIKPEYHDRLQRGAEWINNHPDTQVTIEGHCDQRGSIKYNQILGEKRAKVTRDCMVKLGVDPARLTVTSVGEEKPFADGQDRSGLLLEPEGSLHHHEALKRVHFRSFRGPGRPARAACLFGEGWVRLAVRQSGPGGTLAPSRARRSGIQWNYWRMNDFRN